MTRAERLAAILRNAETYLDCMDECQELCEIAGLEEEWAESDGETFEAVLYEAAMILEVEI